MAKIVLGLASSHSPQLSTTPDLWPRLGENDKLNPELTTRDGRPATYDDLLAVADPSVTEELTAEKFTARFEALQQGIARLSETLERVSPDALIVVGDDQDEILLEDNRPAMLVYWGESILNVPMGQATPVLRPYTYAWQAYGTEVKEYPVASDLGRHLIESLMKEEFDVAHSRRLLPDGPGVGHAFTFVIHRIMHERPIPIVPVMLNTYYPPNQPSPKRCFELGEALRRGVETWDSNARIAIVASGGLSHFNIDEELDYTILAALENQDGGVLCSLPEEKLRAGSSEIRNWITAAAAVQGLSFKTVDYVPCYRSPAGTGGGWAFGEWT